MNAPSQVVVKAPRVLLGFVAFCLFAPGLAVLLIVLAQSPKVHLGAMLLQLLPTASVKLLLLLALAYVKVTVVVEPEGIRVAGRWFLPWSNIAAAEIRTERGFRVLRLTRTQGRPVLFWLRACETLPEFLADQAPEGHPLKQLF